MRVARGTGGPPAQSNCECVDAVRDRYARVQARPLIAPGVRILGGA
ncbi:hypothetical protein BURCENK562V_C5813 [Burkholderia cenocepacia K56-2Valvano]|nr:hypothetical protein BURCENK562V_C5813 [Burkholderia cenocepacia K56-2Valvano]